MASDHREPRRRAIDPLMDVAVEGVAAGYRGVEYVTLGLSEGLRRRQAGFAASGSSARHPRARNPPPRGGRHAAPASAVGEIATLAAELLDRLGEAAHEVAGHIGEHAGGAAHCPTLELCGSPGETDTVKFRLTNTSASALTDVTFEATDLVGAAGRIAASAVSFGSPDGQGIGRIRSGGSKFVLVAIEIPKDAAVGIYRGVMCTRSVVPPGRAEVAGGPEDAWALLDLEVVAPDPRTVIVPNEPAPG